MDAVSRLLQGQFVGVSGLSPPLALALPDIYLFRAPVNAQVYNFIQFGLYTIDNVSFCFTITIIHPQNMVQIVHVPGHWLVVSTVGCSPGTVKVYDSALPAWGTKYFSTSRGKVLEKSLATLLSNSCSEITVEFANCTQQRGVTACGLYAAAHATGLCLGQDQVTVLYDQAVMRDHLLHCFEAGEMRGFPQGRLRAQELDRRRQAPLWQEYLEFVPCICNRPWLTSMPVVECKKCNKNYHLSCMGRKRRSPRNWVCPNCITET